MAGKDLSPARVEAMTAATQRWIEARRDRLNRERRAAGQPPITPEPIGGKA